MSTKIANYLEDHLSGDVSTAKDVRRYFKTDGSVFELEPSVVIYPRNTSDVRKTVRFAYQLASKGKVVPITARGRGTDQSGGALGSGIMLVFPAHMKHLLELDTGKKTAIIQPGINYQTFQHVLHTHGLFMPPYPSSIDYATLGGAVANNTSGEKTLKYGSTRNFVEGLDVVLSNGELIHVKKLNAKQFAQKKGQSNFEGQIYREIDALIRENKELISDSTLDVSKNSAGYFLDGVIEEDGSVDLSKLIVGSQGTLGIVTKIHLKLEEYTPDETLFSVQFDSIHKADEAVSELMELDPSALEFVDENLLKFIAKHSPKRLKGLVDLENIPKIVLLCEFDDNKKRVRAKKAKAAVKIFEKHSNQHSQAEDHHQRQELWKIRHSAAAVATHAEGDKKALPIIEDGVVPRHKFVDFIDGVYGLFEKYNSTAAVWGHAGNANLHVQPFFDLSKTGDRQDVFRLMDDYYTMVASMGGSTAGEHNDGRLRGPYLPMLYGEEMYAVFKKVKTIFDPLEILNPGVKIDVKKSDIIPLLRHEFSIEHWSDHLIKT